MSVAAVRPRAVVARCLAWATAICLLFATSGCGTRPLAGAQQGQPAPTQQQQQQQQSSSPRAAKSRLPEPARSPTGSPTAPISATDPCASQLHELCGPLLYYYAMNRRLPEQLDELKDLAGPDPAVSFECPVSRRPYVYVPDGLAWGDKPGFVVLHDAEPSHSGFRWAVVVERPQGAQPLLTRVVAVPEPLFLGRPAAEEP